MMNTGNNPKSNEWLTLAIAEQNRWLAEAEAEERTRIGNTPTCDACGQQHNEEQDCPVVDVCIAGNPAEDGICGDEFCICFREMQRRDMTNVKAMELQAKLDAHVCQTEDERGLCVDCGADMSETCDACQRRGTHAQGCILSDATQEGAVEEAEAAFWSVIKTKFPGCKTGDLSPDTFHRFQIATHEAVREWVLFNR